MNLKDLIKTDMAGEVKTERSFWPSDHGLTDITDAHLTNISFGQEGDGQLETRGIGPKDGEGNQPYQWEALRVSITGKLPNPPEGVSEEATEFTYTSFLIADVAAFEEAFPSAMVEAAQPGTDGRRPMTGGSDGTWNYVIPLEEHEKLRDNLRRLVAGAYGLEGEVNPAEYLDSLDNDLTEAAGLYVACKFGRRKAKEGKIGDRWLTIVGISEGSLA